MASTSPSATTESVLDHHLAAFTDQDLDETLADYDEDSVVVTNTNGSFRGLDEIRTLFEGLFAEFGQNGVDFQRDQQVVEGDIAYITWHAETPDNAYEFATDTFLIRDGTIETQTLGAVVTPKN
ncbi:nuclear transport factor 2 family protein [Halobaculum sp. CBA1158]|uniref:nuclear transport factor 2 family protein n=1 Tax=Halobaculum sp. CBA1158 TaxID=2904243 RepID=UPI001F4168EA|nr:nuclear transport factor 2 family protein [Halobaculum sp. CBA1158]UIO98566.1 nuclear transport factor 2 family protein [Halobaculum sp. CBA1158]